MENRLCANWHAALAMLSAKQKSNPLLTFDGFESEEWIFWKHFVKLQVFCLKTTCLNTACSNETPQCQTKLFYHNLKKWNSSRTNFGQQGGLQQWFGGVTLQARAKICTLGATVEKAVARRSGQLCKLHGDDSGKQTTRTRVAPIFFWKKQLCLKRTTSIYIGVFFLFFFGHTFDAAPRNKTTKKQTNLKPRRTRLFTAMNNTQAWKTR